MSFEDPEYAHLISEQRAAFVIRMAPSQVVTRAGTMLRMVQQGLRDMQETDHDRILLGFLGVVVFGRSMTLVMQNLRTYGRDEFDAWYAPWQEEMRSDSLLRYFNDLRTKVIHKDTPAISILLASSDRSEPPISLITIEELPLPKTHLGQPLDNTSMSYLCHLYATYLERMFAAFTSVAFGVQDRLLTAEQQVREGPDGAA